MSESNRYGHGGWTIQQSIAFELDLALSAVGGGDLVTNTLIGELTFPQNIPTDWRALWPQMLGESRSNVSVLEPAARMAGVLLGGDYEQVTLAIRELTMADALARIEQQAAQFDLMAKHDVPLPERLVDLATRLDMALYTSVGLVPDMQYQRIWHKDIERAVRILHDGDLHSRFWFWLDRFYFEVYRPWRETRTTTLETLKKQALAALGAEEKQDTLPDLSWLSAQNGVLRFPELHAAVNAGQLSVCFWIEPFGLPDVVAMSPGQLVISFAEPGDLFQKFHDLNKDLAMRTNALGDPTRLMILRLIRHFGMINTEIADYLQLARPTVSVHAKILREAGLIRSRQEGRLVRHEIIPTEIRRLFRDLEGYLGLPEEE